jgi:diaminohydroxyphosphoribosylaminopyrimidine deaminase/5-amino-6-(5-phosphoribosylamino)uracil reductase
MHRCLELAGKGAGLVAPNPMVGAVLVYNDRIIGEGWHQQYGGPHAEVHCIGRAVKDGLSNRIEKSTLYVSLEPCAHFGKTPPCTDLIIQHKIPRVVIGCRDPFKEVDGKGIEKLKAAGVEVVTGILENECRELNKRFFTFHTQHRPYVILKWAETSDGFIAPLNLHAGKTCPKPSEGEALESSGFEKTFPVSEAKVPPAGGFRGAFPSGFGEARLLISNEYTNRLVHQWRSEEAAILVGTNTALYDDPELTTRLWPGPSPVRLLVDMDLRLPKQLRLFNEKTATVVFNTRLHDMEKLSLQARSGLGFYQVTHDVSLVHQIINALYRLNLQSVLVEGGVRLLQSFIDEGAWDEARMIKNEKLIINCGLRAPAFPNAVKTNEQKILSDTIVIYQPTETVFGDRTSDFQLP